MPTPSSCSLCFGPLGACNCPRPQTITPYNPPIVQRPIRVEPLPPTRRIELREPVEAPLAPPAPTVQRTRIRNPRVLQEALEEATNPLRRRPRSGALVGAPSGVPGRPIATDPGHLYDGASSIDGFVLGNLRDPEGIRRRAHERAAQRLRETRETLELREGREFSDAERASLNRPEVQSPDAFDLIAGDDDII